MCEKMSISAYILKKVENNPFLRLQMSAKENVWNTKTEKILNVTSKFLSQVRT